MRDIQLALAASKGGIRYAADIGHLLAVSCSTSPVVESAQSKIARSVGGSILESLEIVVLIIMTAIWLVLVAVLMRRFATQHREKMLELGGPSNFQEFQQSGWLFLFRVLIRNAATSIEDPVLSSLIPIMRIYFVAWLAQFVWVVYGL